MDIFGVDLFVSGDTALIPAPWADDVCGGCNSGALHVFEFDGVSWNRTQKIVPDDLGAQDELGSAVLWNDTILAGAQGQGPGTVDGALDVSDAIFLLNALFVASAAQPAEPFPGCGLDGTVDGLECDTVTVCP